MKQYFSFLRPGASRDFSFGTLFSSGKRSFSNPSVFRAYYCNVSSMNIFAIGKRAEGAIPISPRHRLGFLVAKRGALYGRTILQWSVRIFHRTHVIVIIILYPSPPHLLLLTLSYDLDTTNLLPSFSLLKVAKRQKVDNWTTSISPLYRRIIMLLHTFYP